MSQSKPWWLWSNRETQEYLEETGQVSVGRTDPEEEFECVELEEVTA